MFETTTLVTSNHPLTADLDPITLTTLNILIRLIDLTEIGLESLWLISSSSVLFNDGGLFCVLSGITKPDGVELLNSSCL